MGPRSYASALVSDSSYAKKTHPSVAGRSFLIAFLFTPPMRAATATVVNQLYFLIFLFTLPMWAAALFARYIQDNFYSRRPHGWRRIPGCIKFNDFLDGRIDFVHTAQPPRNQSSNLKLYPSSFIATTPLQVWHLLSPK